MPPRAIFGNHGLVWLLRVAGRCRLPQAGLRPTAFGLLGAVATQ